MDGVADIFVLAAIGIVGAIIAIFLKDTKLPVFAILVALAVGAIIFLQVIPKLGQLFDLFESIAQSANLSALYLNTIFKVLGVAYIAEFAAQLCRDAGQGSIAVKIEFAAKTGILMLSMPIMISILNSVINLLS